MFLAKGVTFLYLVLVWFGLIDGALQWVRRHRSVPIGWAALVILPLALSYAAIWPFFFAAACLGAVGFHLTRSYLKHQGDPESLLLFFCSTGSTVASGAVAGLTIALFLFAAGLLDQWERWGAVELFWLVGSAAGSGALLGVLRKLIRIRWPEPLWIGNVPRAMPGVATARGAAISAPFSTGGFWVDEILLALICTPFLWGALSSITGRK